MHIFLMIFLFVFWTLFWSFASVLIYRIKSGEGWIMMGRSHCKTCERNLSAIELIPIFSWLFQEWKCKWCKSPISSIYPILEITTGILFSAAWYFLIDTSLLMWGDFIELGKLLFFLSIMFLTVIYVFYDILYLEIPEWVLIWANIITFSALIAQWFNLNIIPYLAVWNINWSSIAICLSIILALYYVMLAGLKEIYDCLIVFGCVVVLGWYIYLTNNTLSSSALISGTAAALWVFISFFLQIILSGGRAMWWWDLRIALLMWMLVWASLAFPAWMICYLIGSIIGILLLLRFKIKNWLKSGFNHQIPFGPFIACGYLAILFFHREIWKFIEWYL